MTGRNRGDRDADDATAPRHWRGAIRWPAMLEEPLRRRRIGNITSISIVGVAVTALLVFHFVPHDSGSHQVDASVTSTAPLDPSQLLPTGPSDPATAQTTDGAADAGTSEESPTTAASPAQCTAASLVMLSARDVAQAGNLGDYVHMRSSLLVLRIALVDLVKVAGHPLREQASAVAVTVAAGLGALPPEAPPDAKQQFQRLFAYLTPSIHNMTSLRDGCPNLTALRI